MSFRSFLFHIHFYLASYFLIAIASVDAENIFSFCPISSWNGTIYDASDPSALVTSGESRTRCALRCFSMNQGACFGFGYNSTNQQCRIYFSQPTNYTKATSSGESLTFQVCLVYIYIFPNTRDRGFEHLSVAVPQQHVKSQSFQNAT